MPHDDTDPRYAAALEQWETEPNSVTSGQLRAAAIEAGYACPGCDLIPAVCASGDPAGCRPVAQS